MGDGEVYPQASFRVFTLIPDRAWNSSREFSCLPDTTGRNYAFISLRSQRRKLGESTSGHSHTGLREGVWLLEGWGGVCFVGVEDSGKIHIEVFH